MTNAKKPSTEKNTFAEKVTRTTCESVEKTLKGLNDAIQTANAANGAYTDAVVAIDKALSQQAKVSLTDLTEYQSAAFQSKSLFDLIENAAAYSTKRIEADVANLREITDLVRSGLGNSFSPIKSALKCPSFNQRSA